MPPASDARIDDLPPALPAMWRAVKRGFVAEPALISIAFALSLVAAVPDALTALWLMFLADGLLDGRGTLVAVAAGGLAVSATLTWVLRVASDRTQRRFRDRVAIALESHVAELQASVATVEHHERPTIWIGSPSCAIRSSDRRAAWERWYGPVARARWGSAVWHTAGWAVFGAGFVGAVVFTAYGIDATPGQVLLVLAAGSRLSAYIGAAAGEIGFLRGIWMDGSKRMAWLEDYAAAKAERADQAVPDAIREGIALEGVSFAYPGTDKLVLKDVDCPPGRSWRSSEKTAPARPRS